MDNPDVTVKSIIPQTDQWKNKLTEVKDCLISMCSDEIILFKNQNYQCQIIITTKIRDNFAKVSSVEIVMHKATLGLVTVYIRWEKRFLV